jgi:hypothetical protein
MYNPIFFQPAGWGALVEVLFAKKPAWIHEQY